MVTYKHIAISQMFHQRLVKLSRCSNEIIMVGKCRLLLQSLQCNVIDCLHLHTNSYNVYDIVFTIITHYGHMSLLYVWVLYCVLIIYKTI